MLQGNTPISSNTEDDKVCRVCGGENLCNHLGMVRHDVPIDHPDFGKMFRCQYNNASLDEERKSRLRKLSNLDAFSDRRFANFETNRPMLSAEQTQSLVTAYNVAQRFADKPEGWLLLEGAYGCGKTHLAAAVGNTRIEAGDFVIFITAPDLLDHLRSAYGPSSEMGYDATFERIRNANLLIIDDLGVENPSPWAQEKLFQLLNHRYSYELPTVITTNVDIDSFDARIRSRILHTEFSHRVKISAPDYRSSVESKQDQLLSNLNLYRNMRFETFEIDTNLTPKEHSNLNMILEGAIDYADSPQGWLVLMGLYGTGKTHLAAAIANEQELRGHHVVFLTVPDLMDYLRVAFDPSAGTSFDKRFQTVRRSELLILDDLGTENATSWAKEKLFQILDYRYVANLPTVITTSNSLPDINPRIRTRIMDERRCRVLLFSAQSYAERRKRR